MSFSYNPFEHIEVMQDDNDPNLWSAYCHSCGAQLKMHSDETSLKVFIDNTRAHLKSSHDRQPDNFKGWIKF